MSRPGYARAVLELYVSYFGRPASTAELVRFTRVIDPTPDCDPHVVPPPGPSAAEARRAQIKRNGGKR